MAWPSLSHAVWVKTLPIFGMGGPTAISAPGFRGTFHRFGRHIEAGQQFDLPPSMVEWRF